MQDAITSIINSADVQGQYLDGSALDNLKAYFQTGELRVRAANAISATASLTIAAALALMALAARTLSSPVWK